MGVTRISWEEKFAHDLWYVEHQSLLLDLRIICMHGPAGDRRTGISEAGHATMSEYMGVARLLRTRAGGMSGILVLGAGGHGKVVADILCCEGLPVIGFLDDDPTTWGTARLGLPVLGASRPTGSTCPAGSSSACGDTAARRRSSRVSARSARPLAQRHPPARDGRPLCAARARCRVMARRGRQPGRRSRRPLRRQHGRDGGPRLRHRRVRAHRAGAHLAGGVRVGCGAFIGIGASITQCRAIGDGATVGAGSVVIDDVPAYVTVKGVPARP